MERLPLPIDPQDTLHTSKAAFGEAMLSNEAFAAVTEQRYVTGMPQPMRRMYEPTFQSLDGGEALLGIWVSSERPIRPGEAQATLWNTIYFFDAMPIATVDLWQGQVMPATGLLEAIWATKVRTHTTATAAWWETQCAAASIFATWQSSWNELVEACGSAAVIDPWLYTVALKSKVESQLRPSPIFLSSAIARDGLHAVSVEQRGVMLAPLPRVAVTVPDLARSPFRDNWR